MLANLSDHDSLEKDMSFRSNFHALSIQQKAEQQGFNKYMKELER